MYFDFGSHLLMPMEYKCCILHLYTPLIKLRLDTFWMYEDIKYDFTAELTGTGDRSECDSGNYY